MARFLPLAAFGMALTLAGCATTPGPVDVTRFHRLQAAPLNAGSVSVTMDGADANLLSGEPWRQAVAAELARLGYPASTGSPAYRAVVRHERALLSAAGVRRSPVSVGVGGSTGSYGSGIGGGVGIDLTSLFNRRAGQQFVDDLSVRIVRAGDGYALWEGRAEYRPTTREELQNPTIIAQKMAEALFRGFPGEDGKSIRVE